MLFRGENCKIGTDLSKNDTLHFSLPAHCVIVKDIIMTDWGGIQFPDYFVIIIITVCPRSKWITFNIVQLRSVT